jgi:hypothetical protein
MLILTWAIIEDAADEDLVSCEQDSGLLGHASAML